MHYSSIDVTKYVFLPNSKLLFLLFNSHGARRYSCRIVWCAREITFVSVLLNFRLLQLAHFLNDTPSANGRFFILSVDVICTSSIPWTTALSLFNNRYHMKTKTLLMFYYGDGVTTKKLVVWLIMNLHGYEISNHVNLPIRQICKLGSTNTAHMALLLPGSAFYVIVMLPLFLKQGS